MVQPTFWQLVGRKMKLHRQQAGYTRDDMAQILDMSVTSVGNMEMGVQGIRLDRAKVIADACGVTLNDLVEGT